MFNLNQHIKPSIAGPFIAITIGLFMVISDGTVMNVALPGLIKEFDRPLSVVQWLTSGYALALAAVIPLAGWLSDRFGAKQVFLVSVGLFTVGSLLCAMSTSIEMLILFRVLQGLGGGMVMPVSMTIIYQLSPQGKAGTMMGMLGIPILLALAMGPIVGGLLMTYASWPWIFLINIPVGLICIIVGFLYVPHFSRQSVVSLDIPGMLFGPLAFAALAFGISEGSTSWMSLNALISILVGVFALFVFIRVELNRSSPLLDLSVFGSADFLKGMILQWFSQITMVGMLFLIPLFLMQTRNFNAFEVSLIMIPQAIGSGVLTPLSGRMFDKIGIRPLVISGMLCVACASYMLATLPEHTSIISMMLPLALLGAGTGLSMMPLKTYVLQIAPQNLVSRITSLMSSTEQVMTSFAIAGLSTILMIRIDYHTELGITPNEKILSASFGDTQFIVAGIAFVGAILGLLLRMPKNQT